MFADYYASLIAQLGGEQIVSQARRMLCRRASLFEVELNIIEGELAKLRGQGSMRMLSRKVALEWLAQYTTMVNSQRRVLEAVGLNRVAREVPSLSTYIAEIEAAKADAAPRGGGVPLDGSEHAGSGQSKFTASPTAQDAEVVE